MVLRLRAGLNALPQQRWGWAAAELDEGQVDLALKVGAPWQARAPRCGVRRKATRPGLVVLQEMENR